MFDLSSSVLLVSSTVLCCGLAAAAAAPGVPLLMRLELPAAAELPCCSAANDCQDHVTIEMCFWLSHFFLKVSGLNVCVIRAFYNVLFGRPWFVHCRDRQRLFSFLSALQFSFEIPEQNRGCCGRYLYYSRKNLNAMNMNFLVSIFERNERENAKETLKEFQSLIVSCALLMRGLRMPRYSYDNLHFTCVCKTLDVTVSFSTLCRQANSVSLAEVRHFCATSQVYLHENRLVFISISRKLQINFPNHHNFVCTGAEQHSPHVECNSMPNIVAEGSGNSVEHFRLVLRSFCVAETLTQRCHVFGRVSGLVRDSTRQAVTHSSFEYESVPLKIPVHSFDAQNQSTNESRLLISSSDVGCDLREEIGRPSCGFPSEDIVPSDVGGQVLCNKHKFSNSIMTHLSKNDSFVENCITNTKKSSENVFTAIKELNESEGERPLTPRKHEALFSSPPGYDQKLFVNRLSSADNPDKLTTEETTSVKTGSPHFTETYLQKSIGATPKSEAHALMAQPEIQNSSPVDDTLRKCPGCSLRFVSPQRCLVHMQQQHMAEVPRSHGTRCVDPRCPVLVKVFNEASHLLKHVLRGKHDCKYCSFSCGTRGGLARHHLIHERSRGSRSLQGSSRRSDQHSEVGLVETTPPAKTSNGDEFEAVHHNYNTKRRIHFSEPASGNSTLDKNGSSKRRCIRFECSPHLGIRLPQYDELHFKENTSEEINNFTPPDKCYVCGLRFLEKESAVDMALHYYEQHKNLVPFQCPFPKCPLVLRQAALMLDHLRNHMWRQRFSCVMCSFSAPASKTIKLHARAHVHVQKPIRSTANLQSPKASTLANVSPSATSLTTSEGCLSKGHYGEDVARHRDASPACSSPSPARAAPVIAARKFVRLPTQRLKNSKLVSSHSRSASEMQLRDNSKFASQFRLIQCSSVTAQQKSFTLPPHITEHRQRMSEQRKLFQSSPVSSGRVGKQITSDLGEFSGTFKKHGTNASFSKVASIRVKKAAEKNDGTITNCRRGEASNYGKNISGHMPVKPICSSLAAISSSVTITDATEKNYIQKKRQRKAKCKVTPSIQVSKIPGLSEQQSAILSQLASNVSVTVTMSPLVENLDLKSDSDAPNRDYRGTVPGMHRKSERKNDVMKIEKQRKPSACVPEEANTGLQVEGKLSQNPPLENNPKKQTYSCPHCTVCSVSAYDICNHFFDTHASKVEFFCPFCLFYKVFKNDTRFGRTNFRLDCLHHLLHHYNRKLNANVETPLDEACSSKAQREIVTKNIKVENCKKVSDKHFSSDQTAKIPQKVFKATRVKTETQRATKTENDDAFVNNSYKRRKKEEESYSEFRSKKRKSIKKDVRSLEQSARIENTIQNDGDGISETNIMRYEKLSSSATSPAIASGVRYDGQNSCVRSQTSLRKRRCGQSSGSSGAILSGATQTDADGEQSAELSPFMAYFQHLYRERMKAAASVSDSGVSSLDTPVSYDEFKLPLNRVTEHGASSLGDTVACNTSAAEAFDPPLLSRNKNVIVEKSDKNPNENITGKSNDINVRMLDKKYANAYECQSAITSANDSFSSQQVSSFAASPQFVKWYSFFLNELSKLLPSSQQDNALGGNPTLANILYALPQMNSHVHLSKLLSSLPSCDESQRFVRLLSGQSGSPDVKCQSPGTPSTQPLLTNAVSHTLQNFSCTPAPCQSTESSNTNVSSAQSTTENEQSHLFQYLLSYIASTFPNGGKV